MKNEKKNNPIFGERLLYCREKVGETQTEIGKLCGVDKSTVCRWEQGFTSRIGLPTITLLAFHFNVSESWLLGKGSLDGSIESTLPLVLSEREKRLILSYRAHPEHQPTIDKVLELE